MSVWKPDPVLFLRHSLQILTFLASSSHRSLLVLLRDRCVILQQNIDTMAEDEKMKVTGIQELVMKCLWKLTKQVPQLLESRSIDLRELLHEIHETLKLIPPSEYKKSAHKYPNKDLPVRTVKTLLSELAGCLGQNVFAYIDPQDIDESNVVLNYVQQALDIKKKKQLAEAPSAAAESRPGTASSISAAIPSSTTSRTVSSSSAPRPSAPVSTEELAKDLQGLKVSIQSSELPIESAISTLPTTLQSRIRSQLSSSSVTPVSMDNEQQPALSESERRQEKFLQLKRLMVGSAYESTSLPYESC